MSHLSHVSRQFGMSWESNSTGENGPNDPAMAQYGSEKSEHATTWNIFPELPR